MDPDEARRRILEELSRGEYGRRQGLLGWLIAQVQRLLSALQEGIGGAAGAVPVVVVAFVLVLVVLVVLLRRRSGALRRRARWSPALSLDADPSASASELLDRARAAASAQRSDDAVVLALRALVRDLEERTLLDVTDGMTAHEAADGAAQSFPDVRTQLNRTAAAFDTAAYSHRPATSKQAVDAVMLAQYLAQATPDLQADHAEAGR